MKPSIGVSGSATATLRSGATPTSRSPSVTYRFCATSISPSAVRRIARASRTRAERSQRQILGVAKRPTADGASDQSFWMSRRSAASRSR